MCLLCAWTGTHRGQHHPSQCNLIIFNRQCPSTDRTQGAPLAAGGGVAARGSVPGSSLQTVKRHTNVQNGEIKSGWMHVEQSLLDEWLVSELLDQRTREQSDQNNTTVHDKPLLLSGPSLPSPTHVL